VIITLLQLHDKVASRACRARRVERVEPCCSTQPKWMGSTRRTCRVVSRRDEPSGIWAIDIMLEVQFLSSALKYIHALSSIFLHQTVH